MLTIKDIAKKVATRNNKSFWFSKKLEDGTYTNVNTPSEGVLVWFDKDASTDDLDEVTNLLEQHQLQFWSNSMLPEDHPKYQPEMRSESGCISVIAVPITQ